MEDRIEEAEVSDCAYFAEAGEETGRSRLRWILNAGLGLGKKAAITGIVVSSVPILLPPLVVISALGFAMSVPYGIVLACYVGTEKLMSKLLPPPAEELEYLVSSVLPHEVVEIGAIVDMEEEEKGYSEMRIEMMDDDVENSGVRGDTGGESVCVEVEESGVDGQEEEREEVLLELEVGGLGAGVDGEEPPMVDGGEKGVTGMDGREEILEDTSVEVERNDTGLEAETEVKKGQTEKRSVEGSERRGRKKTSAAQNLLGKGGKSEGDKENGEFPGRDEELLEKSKATSEEEGPEAVLGTSGDGSGKINGLLEKEEKPVGLREIPDAVGREMGRDEVSDVSGEEKQAGKQESELVVGGGLTTEKVGNDVDRSLEKEQGPVGLEEVSTGQGVKDGSVSDVDLKMTEKGSPSEVVVASEAAESLSANDKVTESYSQLMVIASDGEYSVEMATATVTVTPELIHEVEIHALEGEEDAPAVSSDSHSTEAALRDEDIWKKIDAVRGIVGYKAPRRPSYFEELKALYLFTGIEPPSASMDSSGLPEFYNKLSFLMLVIGLK